MLDWYDKVSERLTREAEADHVNKERDEERTFTSSSDADSANDRKDAAGYFADPLYRDRVDRPNIVRRYRPAPRRSTREYVEQRGKDLIHSVRHLVIGPRRRSRKRYLPDRPGQEPDSEDGNNGDATPTTSHLVHVPRRSSRQRNRPLTPDSSEGSPRYSSHSPRTRRLSPPQSTASSPESSRRNPVIRRQRSHDMPSNRRDVFAAYYEHPRRHSAQMVLEKEGFAPSKAPPFAQKVALAHGASASSGRPHTSTALASAPLSPSYGTDRPLTSAGNYAGRPTSLRYSKRGSGDSMSEHEYERFRPEDSTTSRVGERLESRGERRRSHSEDPRGSYDFGDEENVGGERSRPKRALHRYVTVNGVGGRRYPVEQTR
jgi:hypothetical protein